MGVLFSSGFKKDSEGFWETVLYPVPRQVNSSACWQLLEGTLDLTATLSSSKHLGMGGQSIPLLLRRGAVKIIAPIPSLFNVLGPAPPHFLPFLFPAVHYPSMSALNPQAPHTFLYLGG